jgi:hypothetical protein
MAVSINGTNGVTFNDGTAVGTAASLGVRNKIINGAMEIDQRNAGASVTQTTANLYTVDRWVVSGSVTTKFTAQQNASGVTPPVGFTNYLGITSSSSYSVSTGDVFYLMQGIEGLNVSDFGWGTANARAVSLSFWVRSSLTGTFGGAIRNLITGATRSYPFSFSINSANTWEYKTVQIPGDTAGTWATNNTNSVTVCFGLGAGSTYSGTAGAWATANLSQPTGAVSVVGTNGATFYLTGVQLEVGSVATPFERRLYPQELAMCQRYYEIGNQPLLYISFGATGIGAAYGDVRYAVTKRASPTVIITSGWQYYSGGTGVSFTPTTSGIVDRFTWANSGFTNWNGWSGSGTWGASAEL